MEVQLHAIFETAITGQPPPLRRRTGGGKGRWKSGVRSGIARVANESSLFVLIINEDRLIGWSWRARNVAIC